LSPTETSTFFRAQGDRPHGCPFNKLPKSMFPPQLIGCNPIVSFLPARSNAIRIAKNCAFCHHTCDGRFMHAICALSSDVSGGHLWARRFTKNQKPLVSRDQQAQTENRPRPARGPGSYWRIDIGARFSGRSNGRPHQVSRNQAFRSLGLRLRRCYE